MNKKNVVKLIEAQQIDGLVQVEPEALNRSIDLYSKGQKMTLVNIICPGYQKRRDVGQEEFDFKELSEEIEECPNVRLMVDKMNSFAKSIESTNGDNLEVEMILADVAILNYAHLSNYQDVSSTLNHFYKSIFDNYKAELNGTKFVKMSELPFEFSQIPVQGIDSEIGAAKYALAHANIRAKADEYVGSLMFDRINNLRSEGKYDPSQYRELLIKTKREVIRFVVEYGFAGKAIAKMHENPLVLFTEPSGYMRGYFYNAFLAKDQRVPVIYLK